MYTSVAVKNFRGFEDLAVEDLRRINLIVGKNNTGKTSLLEAVHLLCHPTTPKLTLTLGEMRGQVIDTNDPEPDPLWRALFHRMDRDRTIQIEGSRKNRNWHLTIDSFSNESREERFRPGEDITKTQLNAHSLDGIVLRYQVSGSPATETKAWLDGASGIKVRSAVCTDEVVSFLLSARPHISMAFDVIRFSALVKDKHEDWVVNALKILDDRLQSIAVIEERAGSTIYADLGLPSRLPLSICGEGFVRLFSIIVEVAANRDGVLLIDEIDNGLHHSAMAPLWKSIGKIASDLNVQVFATTHNDEMIRSAIDAFSDDLSILRIHRLDRLDGNIVVTAYDEEALASVRDFGFEVRG